MSNNIQGFGPSSAAEKFQRSLAEGKIRLQQCTSCSLHVYPPREVCSHCGSITFEWPEISGQGTVYSHTWVNRKPDAGGPYNVSLIDLDEGVRMMSRVEGVSAESVQIGMRVQAYVSAANDEPIILFERSPI